MTGFLPIFALIIMLVSCSPAIPEGIGTGTAPADDGSPVRADVVLEYPEEKILEAESPTDIAWTEYRAMPEFEWPEPSVELVGCQDEWRIFTADTQYRASLGYYTPGRWHFWVRCFNREGAVIYEGDASVYLREGASNLVPITLDFIWKAVGDATLSLSYTTTEIIDGDVINVHPVIRLYAVKEGVIDSVISPDPAWSKTDAGGGQVLLETVVTGLPQGRYMLTVDLFREDGRYVTGQAVGITLAVGSETEVTGCLEGGEYTDASFAISEDVSRLEGSVTCVSGKYWKEGKKGDDDLTMIALMQHGNVGGFTYTAPVDRMDVFIDGTVHEMVVRETPAPADTWIDPDALNPGFHLVTLNCFRKHAGTIEKTDTKTVRLYIVDQAGWNSGYGGTV